MAGGHSDEVPGETGPRMVFLPALPRSGEQLSKVQAVLKPLEDERLALPVGGFSWWKHVMRGVR